ncbi:uncharacterized protein LOC122849966 [Aphidius gifuensis]|uniref:uncharacterized protein LOC122849966 n=1 Tax=Aphidius gifuensis TaxID=684658 RepID=UPI001CDD629D|nr:uncharacterized protein LOC122849966 [Aphidius gifuensis]
MTLNKSTDLSIDPAPRYVNDRKFLNNTQINYHDNNSKKINEISDKNQMSKLRLKDLSISENSCFYQDDKRHNDIQRNSSSDSITTGNKCQVISKNYKNPQQDLSRRGSSDPRQTNRYIQSAKGTWSYNL